MDGYSGPRASDRVAPHHGAGGKTFEWSHRHLADSTPTGRNQLPTWCMPRLEEIFKQLIPTLPGNQFHVRIELVSIVLARSTGRGVTLSMVTPRDGQDELRVYIRFVLPSQHRQVDVPLVECILHGTPLATVRKLTEGRMRLLNSLPRSFNGKHAALFEAPEHSSQNNGGRPGPAAIAAPDEPSQGPLSLAASGPSILVTTPEEVANCRLPKPATKSSGPLTETQHKIVRIVALAHGMYGGRNIDPGALAGVLVAGRDPVPEARHLIEAMYQKGYFALDESDSGSLRLTNGGYDYCFYGPHAQPDS